MKRTIVQFRIWEDDVMAIFPTVPVKGHGDDVCACYFQGEVLALDATTAFTGSKPAAYWEYVALFKELTDKGLFLQPTREWCYPAGHAARVAVKAAQAVGDVLGVEI